MNFNKFENSNFLKLAKIRIDPETIGMNTNYLPAFEWVASDCLAKIDSINHKEKLDDIHMDFHTAIKTTIPDTESWIDEESRADLYRQVDEVRSMIKYGLENHNKNSTIDKQIQIIRSRLIISSPGSTVHRHCHLCPMTITFCYKFDNNSVTNNEPSHLKLGTYNNIVKAYLPDYNKFYFVMKNNPIHDLSTNEWRFWWITDFTELFDFPELPFPKWDHDYLDGNISR